MSNTENTELWETLDKIFTKMELVEIGEDGSNVYRGSKPFISQLDEATKLIQAKLIEARIDEVERIDRNKIMGLTDVMSYRTTRLNQLRKSL
jgi:hypothetical protein